MCVKRLGPSAVAAVLLVGCIDGGRLTVDLPDTYLGEYDILDPEDADLDAQDDATGDVLADATGPDAVDPDAIAPDTQPCQLGDPGCDECAVDADCLRLDDGNLCNGRWVCKSGACVQDATKVTCGPAPAGLSACETYACVPTTGECAVIPRPNGTACNDFDSCTVGDHCMEGRCVSGPSIFCDDGNPCTVDACKSGVCTYTPQAGAPCDDGNVCTTDDTCNSAGQCRGLVSQCSCAVDADCAQFDDANPCTGEVRCVGGQCRVDLATIPLCHGLAESTCHVAVCNPATGACESQPVPDGHGCNDGDPCTFLDTCAAGQCAGAPLDCGGGPCLADACDPATGACAPVPNDVSGCECEVNADCAALEDGDRCNGTLACVGGRCVVDVATVVRCPASTPCRTVACEPPTGECIVDDASEGAPCDDGDPCTSGDQCIGGVCTGTAADCGVAGACTTNVCHPFAGCRTIHRGGPCDDGDACSQDGCLAGTCATGLVTTCPDPGACLVGVCDSLTGACDAVPHEGACDDGNACTAGDTCAGGVCAGEPIFCDDGNPCTNDTCDPAVGCIFTPNASTCDDGNPCTVGDVCVQGTCAGTPTATCGCVDDRDCAALDDGDACNGTLACVDGQCRVAEGSVVVCDPSNNTACAEAKCDPATGACAMMPRGQGLACDDGDACTVSDVCNGGVCVGLPRGCDDGNPCTADICDPAEGCKHLPATGGDCDDGNACTTGTTCQAGVCGGGTNSCDTCVVDADCAAFDDGNKCNGTVRCLGGQCVLDPATIVTCAPDAAFCTDRRCNPASGACETVPVNEGLACEDGNGCTTGEVCKSGACIGVPRSCDDGEVCTKDACNPITGECVHEPIVATCDDGNSCTSIDTCMGGVCVGTSNTCACQVDADCEAYGLDKCKGEYACVAGGCELVPGTAPQCGTDEDTPCRFGGCDPVTGQCVQVALQAGTECNDGDACTINDRCDSAGACGGTARTCDDGNPCTVDTCDPVLGCVFSPVAAGTACDDGDACTTGTTCNESGVCGGGTNGCSCFKNSDCPQVTDLCQGTYTCVANQCVRGPKVVCPASSNPCRPNQCVPTTGQCLSVAAPNGTTCSDNNPCTLDDACVNSVCTGKKPDCDDDNPCTADSCSNGLCVHTPLTGPSCDDGDICTVGTTCNAGVCGGGLDKCAGCVSDAQCVNIDTNKCNGAWACVDNRCQRVPGTEVVCVDDPDDCVVTSCAPATGQCVHTPRPNGSACSDGSVCTGPDVCNAGVCVGAPLVTCTDPDPDDCVEVYCHPTLGGCLQRPREDGASCTDDDACTEGDRCVAGACQGERVDCDDGNPCTAESCSAELGCLVQAVFGACDDGDPCTEGTVCIDEQCTGGTNTCGCTIDSDCADVAGGDLCAGVWTCVAGQCVHQAGSEVVCPPAEGAPCMVSVCDPGTGTCAAVPVAGTPACDDGDACTILDHCLDGTCKGLKRNCDDGNPCTADSCDPAVGCVNAPSGEGAACDLASCPGGGLCAGGKCQANPAAACGCTSDADCAAHEDGDFCNGTLRCGANGQCEVDPSTVVACPVDPTGCTVAACDPATGACLVDLVPDGALCNDGDVCTSGDVCLSGVCAGEPVGCEDGDPCTRDFCEQGLGCVHEAFAGPCDDGDPCTTQDVCFDGVCAGVPVTCDDGGPCSVGTCDSGQGCVYLPKVDGIPCDDGNPCTTGDVCAGGQCQGSGGCTCVVDADCQSAQPADKCLGQLACVDGACVIDPATVPVCPEATECLDAACDPATGQCVLAPKNEGGSCDDGNACTQGDQCVEGTCVGVAVTCPPSDAPCKEFVCVPAVGCALQDATGPCNDGDGCTIDDRCLGGVCVGQTPATWATSFDDGDLDDWLLDSTGSQAGWHLWAALTHTGPLALRAGNPATGTIADGAAWTATATLPHVFVPPGVTSAELRLALALGVDDPTCATEVFTVAVNGTSAYTACASTDGFQLVTVDLTAHAGTVVEVQLVMEAGATAASGAMGAVVDDLVIDWACPVAGGL